MSHFQHKVYAHYDEEECAVFDSRAECAANSRDCPRTWEHEHVNEDYHAIFACLRQNEKLKEAPFYFGPPSVAEFWEEAHNYPPVIDGRQLPKPEDEVFNHRTHLDSYQWILKSCQDILAEILHLTKELND